MYQWSICSTGSLLSILFTSHYNRCWAVLLTTAFLKSNKNVSAALVAFVVSLQFSSELAQDCVQFCQSFEEFRVQVWNGTMLLNFRWFTLIEEDFIWIISAQDVAPMILDCIDYDGRYWCNYLQQGKVHSLFSHINLLNLK